MAFEYGEVDNSFYEEEYVSQQKAVSGTPVPILYLKDGITIVRVMPPHKDAKGKWMRKIFEHQAKFGDKFVTATCPRMVQKDCPICDLGERLREEGKLEGDAAKMDQGKKLGFRVQYLANVICYSSPDAEAGGLNKGVMVMKFGSKVKQALLDLDQAVDSGWARITDLANGVDIRITRQGRGLQTQYMVMPQGQRSNIQQKLAASGIDLGSLTLHNLDEVMNPREYSELADLMAGQARTAGFLPKPKAQVQAVPVAQPAQPVVLPGTTAAPVQPNPVTQNTVPNFQVPPPQPTTPFVIQPIQATVTAVPVAVPQLPDSPPGIGAPVREVK